MSMAPSIAASDGASQASGAARLPAGQASLPAKPSIGDPVGFLHPLGEDGPRLLDRRVLASA